MAAIVIDLKDFAVRTPEQIIRVFYTLYSREVVEAGLLKILVSYAENEQKGNPGYDPKVAATANLFDHLAALTQAIHQLRAGTPGKCPICGRRPTSDSS